MHHSVLDGPACVQVLEAWAALCRGENADKFIRPELADRGRLLVASEAKTSLDGLPEFIYKKRYVFLKPFFLLHALSGSFKS